MGGFGSGHWIDVATRKVNTSLCRTLSIRTLKKIGVFDADRADERFCIRWVNEFGDDAGAVKITPAVDGHVRSLRVEIGAAGVAGEGFVTVTAQDIQITTTPCFYGGERYWLRCPAAVDGMLCEDRVGVLYLPPAATIFGCRHCHDLTYESCQQSHKYDRVMDHLEGLDIDNLSINQVLRLGGL